MEFTNSKSYKFEKCLFILTILTGFWGVAIFSVDLGPITLFPYRIFLVLLWFFFLSHKFVQNKFLLPELKIKRYFLFFFIWLAYALLTLGWAKDSIAAFEDLVFLTMAFSVIFFTVYYSRKKRDFYNLYWLWIIVLSVFIIIGFWENLTGNHLAVSAYFQETRPRYMYRPTGVFHNPNDYATFLALSLPFVGALARYKSRIIFRLFGLALAFSACFLIILTGSRANILAVFLEIVFFWLIFLDLEAKTRFAIVIVGLAIILTVIAPEIFQVVQSEVSGNLRSLVTQIKSWSGSIRIRFNLVRNGVIFFRSTGGFGVGAGNAKFWMSNFGTYNTGGILNPHNWWLEIFINYGVFISFGFFLFYISLLWNLWKVWRVANNLNKKMISEALLLALVGFFFASMSSSSIMAFKPQWFLFAISLGFLNYCFLNYSRKGKIS